MSQRKNSKYPFSLPLLVCVLQIVALSDAHADDTFRVHAKFDLCPEYQLGGVSLEYGYRVGAETNYRALTGQNETTNSGNQTGEADFDLPATLGKTPISFAAFCRNARGLSKPSLEKSVTFCDVERLRDSDKDGVDDLTEDTNCNGFFDPGDRSNLFNVDTDGDGVRDLVEILQGKDPSNPGSSPRPFVSAGLPFDPDGNGDSNAVVWRPSEGRWYIKDVTTPGNNVSFPFGIVGDVPFVYNYRLENTATNNLGLRRSDVGVIRRNGTNLNWYFHGKGYEQNGSFKTLLTFGVFGDNIVSGPWETPGVTTLGVAHIFNGYWTFFFLLRDGTVKTVIWGENFDVPKPADYDGDGIFDVAVFRPANQTTYIIRSTDGLAMVQKFGTGTAEYNVRGDFTNDGIQDIAFWEPSTTLFFVETSDNGFNDTQAANHNPNYYLETTLGTYNATLPLNWQTRGGRAYFSVVDHSTGIRQLKDPKNLSSPVESFQWGLFGDSHG